MRVIQPFTADHPKVVEALYRHAPTAERVDVSGDDEAYGRLLESLWVAGEAFVLVEHDIELRDDVMEAFERCSSLWCAFGYRYGPTTMASLGCTRFRAELLSAAPDAPVAHNAVNTDGSPKRYWKTLGLRLKGVLQLRGHRACVHEPPVAHHREFPGTAVVDDYQARCERCGAVALGVIVGDKVVPTITHAAGCPEGVPARGR